MGNTPPPGLHGENVGFKVVDVKSKSPAERSGLKVEADFIISINGQRLYEMDTDAIVALVKANENISMKVIVYNIETDKVRAITLTPSHNWPGDGLLGVVIRFEPFDPEKLPTDMNIAFADIYGDKDEVEDKEKKAKTPAPLSKSSSITETIGSIFTFTSPSNKPSGPKPETETDVSFDNIYNTSQDYQSQDLDYFEGSNNLSPKVKAGEISSPSPPQVNKEKEKESSGIFGISPLGRKKSTST